MNFRSQPMKQSLCKIWRNGAILSGAAMALFVSAGTVRAQVPLEPLMLGDAQVERAFLLRDRWSLWATSHRRPLELVLQSDAKNLTPLNTLVTLLPPEPSRAEAYISWQDLNPPSHDGAMPKAPWIWLPSAQMADDPKEAPHTREQRTNFRKYVQDKWRQDFEKKLDVVIAFSDVPNQKRVSLWASGRITENDLVGAGLLSHEGETEQLFPPYAFLNSIRSPQLLLSDSEKEKRLTQAKELRGQWEKWAIEHKIILQKLLQAKGKDQASLTAVWQALPATNEIVGVSMEKFNGGSSSGNWTWNPAARDVKFDDDPNDPAREKKASQVQRIKSYAAVLLQENFASNSDIALSSRGGIGPSITLWVSGRITLDTLFESSNPGEPVLQEGERQELVTPFEFLNP